MAGANAALGLAVFGLISGLFSGALIVCFRYAAEALQHEFMPLGDADNFEGLPRYLYFWLPVAGAALLGVAFQLLRQTDRQVGIGHVIERLAYHEGYLPLKNFLAQFLGGIVSLVSGHSVGRESPSVHIGAAGSSFIGRRFGLPNNGVRTLVACGSAAAIAASFNTPLAGVVFAMEVILMEYTIAGFTPVILAAVAGSALSRLAFGDQPVLQLPQVGVTSLSELVLIVAMGLVCGAMSALFVATVRTISRIARPRPPWATFTVAGVVTGLAALLAPAVLGQGYDTANHAILGDYAFWVLLGIVACKLLATAFCVGVGLPGGLIGPALVIGACLGAAWESMPNIGAFIDITPGLYGSLGAAAMIGATLHAPLAALLTLLELTGNPQIILPGMLAIVSATIASKELFDQDSVFTLMLRDAGLDNQANPLVQSLQRIGIAAVMNRSVVECADQLTREGALTLLERSPQWIIVRAGDQRNLLRGADLARYLEASEDEEVKLGEIPAQRLELAPVAVQATLYEARRRMQEAGVEALYVRRSIARTADRIFGVVLRQDLDSYYSISR